MRKPITLVIAALLLLAACSTGGSSNDTDSDDTAGNTPTSASSPGLTFPDEPAPGVTDDSIKIGVTYLDTDAISAVVDIDQGDYEAAYNALFDDINAKGGIHGRTLEPVYAPINPIGTAPADEACTHLTEDEQVFLVMGFFLNGAECYVDTHATAVLGGGITADVLANAKAPWFSTEAGSDFQGDALRQFIDDGLISDNVGVFAITTEASLIDDVAVPILEEAGIDPVDTAVLDAPPDDVAAQNDAVGVIAERFKAAGVDQVLVMGSGGLTWANGAQATDFRPQLVLVDKGSMEAYVSSHADDDLSLLDGAIGGGVTMPAADSYDIPEVQDCLGIQADAGYETPDPATLPAEDLGTVAAAFISCSNVALLTAILDGAGDDLDYNTFEQAGEQLGDIHLLGSEEPYHFGPPPSTDGDAPVFVFDYDAEQKLFVLRNDG